MSVSCTPVASINTFPSECAVELALEVLLAMRTYHVNGPMLASVVGYEHAGSLHSCIPSTGSLPKGEQPPARGEDDELVGGDFRDRHVAYGERQYGRRATPCVTCGKGTTRSLEMPNDSAEGGGLSYLHLLHITN